MEESRRTPSTPVWLWLNLLSLDAPLVAIVWQDFAARCFPSPLRPAGRWMLGLTVWAIYLADRLLDIRHPVHPREGARHQFYRRHQRWAKVLLAAVLIADAVVALLWGRPVVMANGLWVAGGVLLYLAAFAYLRPSSGFGKRPAAAVLFAVGVFLIAWSTVPNPWRQLALPAASFCGLCAANLLLIENWEQAHPRQGWIWMLIAGLVFGALGGYSPWYWAASASALGLAALDFAGGSLPADARRVLADAVLLTPVLFRWA